MKKRSKLTMPKLFRREREDTAFDARVLECLRLMEKKGLVEETEPGTFKLTDLGRVQAEKRDAKRLTEEYRQLKGEA